MKSLYRPLFCFLILALLLAGVGNFSVKADGTTAALPFSQDWSNTGLIVIDADWANVPSIIGYRGDTLTNTTTGIDPQTVLADDLSPVEHVIANKSNPNTNTTGGVVEFEITDPVVALQGSGTARAPYLKIVIATAGVNNVQISYDVRDIDGSADNAIQKVALHYRVGSSGSFTNLPDGYIADATEPSLATKVTHVSLLLPAVAENQSVVELRIMTTNATGNDEWVGIDNISITANYAPGGYSLSSDSVLENQPMGVFVGSLTANDANGADTHTFALVSSASCAGSGSDNIYFSITGNTLFTAASFDYESNISYSICAQVTDNHGLSKIGPAQTIQVLNIVDETPPNVNINRSSAQLDPTHMSPINFTVVFSDPVNVSTFTDLDITLGGSAGADTASITEVLPNDGTTFNVAVSGMTASGAVSASIGAGVAQDMDGNVNTSSASADNSVLYDATSPSVDTLTISSFSNSLAISVTAFTASDDVDITGYLITESSAPPAFDDANWSGTPVAEYTVAAGGSYTLYPWAKDAAENVSSVFGSPANVVVDISAPTVDAFTAASSSTSRDVPISLFTASDNVDVTGYLVTESSTPPASDAAGWIVTSPAAYTVIADGTYILYPWAKDAAGNVSATLGSPASVTVDATAPAITSFMRRTPSGNSTNADALIFRAVFSESVTNVSADDFSVNGSDTASITGLSEVSASIYDITISGGDLADFNGYIGLNFNAPNIQDLIGNSFVNAEPVIDQVYTVDNIAPSIISFARQTPFDIHTFEDTLVFRVTFNEGVQNVDVSDFKTNGAATSTATHVTTVSASIYDVTLSGGSLPNFNGIVGLDFNAPDIADPAGNGFIHVEPGIDETYVVFQPFYSNALNDGWTLESAEFSNVASQKNNTGTLRVGDDARNKQYRSLLYFDTASLRGKTDISKVTVRIKKANMVGAPSFITHEDLVADMKKGLFGLAPLELMDFITVGELINTAGKFKTSDSIWYQLTLSPVNFKYINLLGVTQFRLRFAKDDDNNKTADYISFYSGDAANPLDRPQLIVEYEVP